MGQKFHVTFGNRIVARHRIQPSGARRVTLTEHARLIQAFSHRQHKARRPWKAPRFIQLPNQVPEVEIRPLSVYDRYAEEVDR